MSRNDRTNAVFDVAGLSLGGVPIIVIQLAGQLSTWPTLLSS